MKVQNISRVDRFLGETLVPARGKAVDVDESWANNPAFTSMVEDGVLITGAAEKEAAEKEAAEKEAAEKEAAEKEAAEKEAAEKEAAEKAAAEKAAAEKAAAEKAAALAKK